MLLFCFCLLVLHLEVSMGSEDLDEQIFLNNETISQRLNVFYQHIPARHVPPPPVDPKLKREFLELFHVSSGFSNRTKATRLLSPSLIQISLINEINQLCPRNAFFYSFAPRHVQARKILESVFMAQATPREVLNVARNVLERGEVNKKVWFYALLGTILSRPDLSGYHLAWSLDATPDLYLTASVLNSAISNQQTGGNVNTCVIYNGTRGTTRNENRLWYFREDIMVNHYHWYWHQYFPLESNRHADRRGEVFYFMHHNLIARYNAERLSNRMNLVGALNLTLGGSIGFRYNADMIDKQSGKFWTPRGAYVPLQNIVHMNDPDFHMDINTRELEQLLKTFILHIRQGYLLTKNQSDTFLNFQMDIRNFDGINHLGNTVEAVGNLSVHPDFYHPHGLHNLGHILIALAVDPDFSKGLPAGVMADSPVSMRDPAFYKVHGLMDNLFDIYKTTLTPYQLEQGEWPLKWADVTIQNLKIVTAADRRTNLVKTFWSTHTFPLEQGIDGSIHDGDASTNICHVQLNHQPFFFQIAVNARPQMISQSGRGTVRIFMAPRYHSNGRRFRMTETRKLMFQLDSFPVQLKRGRNIILRSSLDSSSTKPWSRSLKQMLQDTNNGGKAEYCGCGWPNHLYIPKGTEEGMQFDLFAMITNFDVDRVQDTPEDLNIPEACHSPHLFCGIPNRKYPDRRPMGYPFDRLPYSTRYRPVESLEEYVQHVSNMKSTVVTIQHSDILIL